MGMSIIYGEKKGGRRRKLAYIILGLAIAAVIASIYYATRPQPEEVIAERSGDLLGALELLSIEYGEAVQNGEVVKESEYKGAREVMDRAMELFREMKPYAMKIDPKLAEEIEKDMERLKEMVHKKSSPEDIAGLTEQISQDIKSFQLKRS